MRAYAKAACVLTLVAGLLILPACTRELADGAAGEAPPQTRSAVEAGNPSIVQWIADSLGLEAEAIVGMRTGQTLDGTLIDGGQATVSIHEYVYDTSSPYHIPVVLIEMSGQELAREIMLKGAYITEIVLADIDGDGQDEIIAHHNTDSIGGNGNYEAAVYKLEPDGLRRIFAYPGYSLPGKEPCDEADYMDVGFELELCDGWQHEIRNRFTHVSHSFIRTQSEEYPYFNPDGSVTDDALENNRTGHLGLDSFFSIFEPVDIDGDGIFEIMTEQYAYLWSRGDMLGNAYTILRWNTGHQAMEVVGSGFLPRDEGEDRDSYAEQVGAYRKAFPSSCNWLGENQQDASSAEPQPATAVTFADATIEALVRLQLGPDRIITSADLLNIEQLGNFEDYNFIFVHHFQGPIATLADLVLLPNVKVAYLDNCSLESLDGIEALVGLEELYISGNTLTDLSPVTELDNLRLLDCTANRIEDLSPLAGLNKLEALYFGYNQVSDISFLESMPLLGTVYADENPISPEDLGRYVGEKDDKFTLLTHRFRVHDSLPEVELRIVGVREPILYTPGSDYYIDYGMERIIVLDLSSGEPLLYHYVPDISWVGSKSWLSESFDFYDEWGGFELVDMNFDGYLDFGLSDFVSGKFQYTMRFLWNTDKGCFEHSPAHSGLVHPTFDDQKQEIRTYLPSGVASFGQEMFRYTGNALIKESEHFYSAVHEFLMNEQLKKEIIEAFNIDENADVLVMEVTQYYPDQWRQYWLIDGWITDEDCQVLHTWIEDAWIALVEKWASD